MNNNQLREYFLTLKETPKLKKEDVLLAYKTILDVQRSVGRHTSKDDPYDSRSLSGFNTTVTAVFGVINNKYLEAYYTVTRASDTMMVPSTADVLDVAMYPKKLMFFYNARNLSTMVDQCLDVLDAMEVIDEAFSKMQSIKKKALRFKKSKYNQVINDHACMVEMDTIMPNTVEPEKWGCKMISYDLNKWGTWHSTNWLTLHDADEWPFIKELYPEEFL